MIKKELIDLTYRALRKWERIVLTGDVGACPYCLVFDHNDCIGCPVFLDTGTRGCHGTPFFDGFSKADDWSEFQYLLNVAYSQGLESKYMEEL